MQKIYLIADLHLGHANIIKYENRPFSSVQHMDESLIKNWNSVVSNKDKIIVNGDFSFYGKEHTQQILSQLNGFKILVMGNHDEARSAKWWLEAGFDEVYKYPIILEEFIIISHIPPQYIPPSTPYFYIYGHVHSSEMYKTITTSTACTSVERWDYTPVDLEQIKLLQKIYSLNV